MGGDGQYNMFDPLFLLARGEEWLWARSRDGGTGPLWRPANGNRPIRTEPGGGTVIVAGVFLVLILFACCARGAVGHGRPSGNGACLPDPAGRLARRATFRVVRR